MSKVYQAINRSVYYKVINSRLVINIASRCDTESSMNAGIKYVDSQAREIIKNLKDKSRFILLEDVEEFNEIAKPIFDAWEQEAKDKLKLIRKIRK